jgi:hypothetical protein
VLTRIVQYDEGSNDIDVLTELIRTGKGGRVKRHTEQAPAPLYPSSVLYRDVKNRIKPNILTNLKHVLSSL